MPRTTVGYTHRASGDRNFGIAQRSLYTDNAHSNRSRSSVSTHIAPRGLLFRSVYRSVGEAGATTKSSGAGVIGLSSAPLRLCLRSIIPRLGAFPGGRSAMRGREQNLLEKVVTLGLGHLPLLGQARSCFEEAPVPLGLLLFMTESSCLRGCFRR
jgi:hypothetical protein